MMKHFFLILLALPTPCFGMIWVTKTCKDNLFAINSDGGKLYYHFKDRFELLAQEKSRDKPSEIIHLLHLQTIDQLLQFNTCTLDNATNLSYKPASWYLSKIISKNTQKIDAAFEKKLSETKDFTATWNWFSEYFFEEGLNKPLADYKVQLLIHDLKKNKSKTSK